MNKFQSVYSKQHANLFNFTFLKPIKTSPFPKTFHSNAPQPFKKHTPPLHVLKPPHHHHTIIPNALNNTDANATPTQSPVLSLRLSTTPAALFHILFEDDFIINFHKLVGHTDLTYNKSPLSLSYRFPVNIPFKGPTYATNTESFTIIQHPGATFAGDKEEAFYVQSKSITKGIPGSDAFEVILHWKAILLLSTNTNTTDFTLTCSINFQAPLPNMVSYQLEKAAYQGIIDAYTPQFETLLLSTRTEFNKDKKTTDKKEEEGEGEVNNNNNDNNNTEEEDKVQPTTLRQLLKTISTTWPEWKNNRYWFLTPTGSPCHTVPSPLEALNILEQLIPIWLKEKKWDKTWYRDSVFKGLVECLRLARPRSPSASSVLNDVDDDDEREDGEENSGSDSGGGGSIESYYYTQPEEVVKLIHFLALLCREDGMYTEELVASAQLLKRIQLVERKHIASVVYSLYTARVWTPSLSCSSNSSLEKAAADALNRDIDAFIGCSRHDNDENYVDNKLHGLPIMILSLSELGQPCTKLIHCLKRGLQAGMGVKVGQIPTLVRSVAVAGGTGTGTGDHNSNIELVKILLLNLIAKNKEILLRERRTNKRREIDMNQLMQFKEAVEVECKDPVITDILQNNAAVKEVFDTAASICQAAYHYYKSNMKKKGAEAYTGSAVQAEVERCVSSLGLNYETEQPLLNRCWVADIVAHVHTQEESGTGTGTGTAHSLVVIEVDGPWHYTRNKYNCFEVSTDGDEVDVQAARKKKKTKKKRQLLGKTAFKRRILERAGYKVVNIDVEEWLEIRGKRTQVEYLNRRIKECMLKNNKDNCIDV